MKEVYQACIFASPIWKDIYAVTAKCRKNMKNRNRLLYVQRLNKQWRLVLPRTFDAEGKNFLEIGIA